MRSPACCGAGWQIPPTAGQDVQMHPAFCGMPSGPMFYVYILKSLKDEKFYIGSTGDLEKRIKRHNAGKNIATCHRRPFEFIHSEIYNTRAEALQRERQIKSYKGGRAFEALIKKIIMRRWQSGQMHETVNLAPSGYGGSNPPLRT